MVVSGEDFPTNPVTYLLVDIFTGVISYLPFISWVYHLI